MLQAAKRARAIFEQLPSGVYTLRETPNYRCRKPSETRGDLYLPLSGTLFTLYRKEENGGRTAIGTVTRDSEGRIDLSQVQFDAACHAAPSGQASQNGRFVQALVWHDAGRIWAADRLPVASKKKETEKR